MNDTKVNDATAVLDMTSPITDKRLRTTHTTFVDDHSTRTCVTINTVATITPALNQALQRHLEGAGMAINDKKTEALLHLRGLGAHTTTQHLMMASPKLNKRHARYLGPYLTWNGSHTHEVALRCKAARQAMGIYSRVWSKDIDFKVKRLFFQAFVTSSLHSGMTACALSRRELDTLGNQAANLLRRLLGQKACKKEYDEDGQVTAYRQPKP